MTYKNEKKEWIAVYRRCDTVEYYGQERMYCFISFSQLQFGRPFVSPVASPPQYWRSISSICAMMLLSSVLMSSARFQRIGMNILLLPAVAPFVRGDNAGALLGVADCGLRGAVPWFEAWAVFLLDVADWEIFAFVVFLDEEEGAGRGSRGKILLDLFCVLVELTSFIIPCSNLFHAAESGSVKFLSICEVALNAINRSIG